MRQKLVSVEDVTIQTAAVEIKTMLIGKKQMTVGMFRQLPSLDIMDVKDDEIELQGVVWGHVNHHNSECVNLDHLHVVWQNGHVLYQSSIYHSVPSRYDRIPEGGDVVDKRLRNLEKTSNSLQQRANDIQIIGGLTAALTTKPQPAKAVVDQYGQSVAAVTVNGWYLAGTAADLALRHWPSPPYARQMGPGGEFWEAININKLIAETAKAASINITAAPDATYRKMHQEVRKLFEETRQRGKKLNTSLQNHYRVLEASDQLFIGG
jgi:hypothetical protein